MWEYITEIAEAIWTGIKGLWNMCKKIIKATISFVHDLLDGLFDILEDIFGDDIPNSVEDSPVKPFIANMDELIKKAPVKDNGLFTQKNHNFLKGAYDTRTGEIISPTYVAAGNIDSKTREEIGDEPLIIVG